MGEPRDEMLPALEAVTERLPADQPRYLMGVGDPLGFVEGIARGVDMFDCVLATRLGRHGTILTSAGRLNLRNAAHARSAEPLDDRCSCQVCGRWSRAYLRHLLMVQEPTASQAAHHPQPPLVPGPHAAGPRRHPRRPVRGLPGRDRRRLESLTVGRPIEARGRSCPSAGLD